MIFLKEQAEQFVGQFVIRAAGSAKGIPLARKEGQALAHIRTFGKEILFCFPDFAIRVHLMLFGKYAINGELNRELHLGLEFEAGEINFYASAIKLIQEPLENVYDWSTDVLNDTFDDNKAFQKLVSKPERLISEALLDQNILAGVGNIIKNEVLYRRQIHPASLVGAIPETELRSLIMECVKLGHQYLDWIREGTDNAHWQVYRKKECLRDTIPLLKEKIGKLGRSCYFCDKCQKLYLPEGY